MKERIILKTHYQVGRPGIFTVLINQCTSPSQSTYSEVVARRLNAVPFKEIHLNTESAKFAVSMAQAMGFLSANLFWDQKGYVIHVLSKPDSGRMADDYLKLWPVEKIIYLKYYLESDGAVILKVCQSLVEKGQLTRSELLSTNLIDKIFLQVWESYRLLTSDLRQKVALKENIFKIRTNGYTKKTRIHKALAHIEPLVDLDLVNRTKAGNEVTFFPRKLDDFSPARALIKALPEIRDLESRLSKDEDFQIIAEVYGIDFVPFDLSLHSEPLEKLILEFYSRVRSSPSGLASIRVISDIVCSTMLAQYRILTRLADIQARFEAMKARQPHKVQFHVDMHGHKSFVALSDDLLSNALPQPA